MSEETNTIQIMPALPGWRLFYKNSDGLVQLPIVCWALQQHERTGDDRYQDEKWQSITPMIVDQAGFHSLVEGDEDDPGLCAIGEYIGIAGPGENMPGSFWNKPETSRQLHETPDSAPQAID